MNNTPWFSSITAAPTRVIESSLWINTENPQNIEQSVSLNIETGNSPLQEDHDHSRYSTDINLSLNIECADSSDASVPRARFKVKLCSKLSIPLSEKNNMTDRKIREVTISLLYPQAQSYIRILSGMGGYGELNMPILDVDALLDIIETPGFSK